ncbi:MAG: hypothetical protein AVDCRST_MAG33-399 [uncultured Thermomicrobiales bacterium]|uniref:Uncharacterized protein n=1 Tax=uncultured Thermomicrobiales bacterium TaxID=1645740 RepID=A0A6J4UC34_9BACT|nr:MAG: hypothetical protein AVDCRST_MAG33-399 [uncultured Thermomicrobiales bacterium]
MNVDERTKGAMSLWEQTRSQRWALVAGLVIGVMIGAGVAILFRPLVIAIILILLALLVYRVVRAVQGRGGSGREATGGPVVRGMVVTGRYAEPGAAARPSVAADPLDDPIPDAAPAARVERDLRRGPAYDAEIDAILANIDRQIEVEGTRPPGRATRPARQARPEPGGVQDAEFHDR